MATTSNCLLEVQATSVIAAALPMPVLVVGPQQEIVFVNPAAEQFFDMGAGHLRRQKLNEFDPVRQPAVSIHRTGAGARRLGGRTRCRLTTPRHGEHVADMTVTPLPGPAGRCSSRFRNAVFAQRIDRQLLHRGAVRSLAWHGGGAGA